MSKPANGSGGERGDAKKRKVTTLRLQEMKEQGERIACLTAYDFVMARLLDEAGIDVLLVGDSAGMVFGGQDTTISVTMPQMLYHATVVARAVKRALVVGDLPFMSYQASVEEALRNAGSFMKEALVEAVKLEGGEGICPTVRRIVDAGIPVMGHLGLTPQSIHKFGTYRTRGTTDEEATQILADARALQDAGVFAIVLEKIPAELAREITAGVKVPTIGIGAGPGCDGQILVTHDMLGLFTRFRPRFVRRYAELGAAMQECFRRYCEDVKGASFPSDDESYWRSEGGGDAP
ncbi:MAG TPA: 3-methyl-2-oxobutanoate hydroxymethyltransferase [Planctomycetota bacterium]|nr:3-methyl-2-oxobutanoate hydroxymethyltransferase [Planctomycetota bacterium]